MENLKVIWSNFAETQLDEILEYHKEQVSFNVANKLVKEIIFKSEDLINAPFIGQKEIRLEKRKPEYRYLVYKNYKLIYSVNEKEGFIKISDVFDTRQHPQKITRKK